MGTCLIGYGTEGAGMCNGALPEHEAFAHVLGCQQTFPQCPAVRLAKLFDLRVGFVYRMWFPTVKNLPKKIRSSCLT